MGVRKSNAALVGVILLLGPLVPYRLAQSRDAETVVPIGALAHAAEVFQEDTGGKVLEIRPYDDRIALLLNIDARRPECGCRPAVVPFLLKNGA